MLRCFCRANAQFVAGIQLFINLFIYCLCRAIRKNYLRCISLSSHYSTIPLQVMRDKALLRLFYSAEKRKEAFFILNSSLFIFNYSFLLII